MKRIYVSSLFRVPTYEQSEHTEVGRLYSIDWETKKRVVGNTEVGLGYVKYVPKSRSRGARGVTVHNGKVYVAGSYNILSVFNKDTFELEYTIEFPEFKGAHQIKSHDGRLFLVSSGNDCRHVVVDDSIVETRTLREVEHLVDRYVLNHPEWGSDRVHFNSIGWDFRGDEYHVYHAADMLMNFTSKKVIMQGGLLNKPHDVAFHRGNILVNSTQNKTTVAVDMVSNEAEVIFKSGVRGGAEHNVWGYTRSLAVACDTIFVGVMPATIVQLEYIAGKYEEVYRYELSDDLNEAIFDVALDPEDWC